MRASFQMPCGTDPITMEEVRLAVQYATDEEFVRWAALRNLIPKLIPPICCQRSMTLTFGTTASAGAVWRCSLCRHHRSIRGDCWLQQAKITLRQGALLLACWIAGRTRDVTSVDCQVSPQTVTRYFDEFRVTAEGIYRDDISRNPLGGPGVVCQIDESLFGKAKYHRGRALNTQMWVFGVVDYGTGRVMMEPVAHRDADTILPVIQSTVAAGSIIWSDMWRAYNGLHLSATATRRSITASNLSPRTVSIRR